MVITYDKILEFLIVNGKYRSQFLIIDDGCVFKGVVIIKRDPAIEKYISIDIEKKMKSIIKTYYSGNITKSLPCIEKIVGNQIYFRSSRAFPTLYIDLLVIDKLFRGVPVELHFKKLFIGYHIIAVNSFYKSVLSTNFIDCLLHWNKRFQSNSSMFIHMSKYYEFLLNAR